MGSDDKQPFSVPFQLEMHSLSYLGFQRLSLSSPVHVLTHSGVALIVIIIKVLVVHDHDTANVAMSAPTPSLATGQTTAAELPAAFTISHVMRPAVIIATMVARTLLKWSLRNRE